MRSIEVAFKAVIAAAILAAIPALADRGRAARRSQGEKPIPRAISPGASRRSSGP